MSNAHTTTVADNYMQILGTYSELIIKNKHRH